MIHCSAPFSPSLLVGVSTTNFTRVREPNMMIIGCDYHPAFQQIAFLATDSGELQEQRLLREEAVKVCRNLAAQGITVRVGMEANGHARWFERLLNKSPLRFRAADRGPERYFPGGQSP
jgi:hypothetical protein